MKKYVSPFMSTVELSAEDILTASDLSLVFQIEGEVIDNVSWNGLNG